MPTPAEFAPTLVQQPEVEFHGKGASCPILSLLAGRLKGLQRGCAALMQVLDFVSEDELSNGLRCNATRRDDCLKASNDEPPIQRHSQIISPFALVPPTNHRSKGSTERRRSYRDLMRATTGFFGRNFFAFTASQRFKMSQ